MDEMSWSVADMTLSGKGKSVLKEMKADACKINGLYPMLAHLERHFVDEDTEKIKCTEKTKGQTAAWDDLINVLKRSDFKAFCDYVEQIFSPDFPCPEEFRSKLKSVCKKYGLQNIFEVNGCSSGITNLDLPLQNEETRNKSFGSPNQSFGSFESTTDKPWSSMESNDVFEIESSNQNGAKEKRRSFRLSSKGSNESKSSRISSSSFGSKGSVDEPGQLSVDSLLSSLPTRVCRKLCDALDCKTVIGSNWHDFADHLNFSQAMMQKLEERDEKMKEIFYYMQHKERKIGDVVEILSSIERKDCLQFLNEAGVKGLPDYTAGIQTQLSQPEQELVEDKELLGNADQTDNCQQTISTQETDKGYFSEEKPERLVLSEKTCQNYVGEATFTIESMLSCTQSESNAYCQGSMLATETSRKVPGNEKRSKSESFLLLGDIDILSKTDIVDEKLTIDNKQRLNDQVETRHKDQLVPRESSTNMLVGCAQKSRQIFQETEGTFVKDPSLSCVDNGFKSDEEIKSTTHGFKTTKTVSCNPDKLKGKYTSYVLTPYALNSNDLNSKTSNSRFDSKIDHSHDVSEQQKVACKGSLSVDLHDGTSNKNSLILEEKIPRCRSPRNEGKKWAKSLAFKKELNESFTQEEVTGIKDSNSDKGDLLVAKEDSSKELIHEETCRLVQSSEMDTTSASLQETYETEKETNAEYLTAKSSKNFFFWLLTTALESLGLGRKPFFQTHQSNINTAGNAIPCENCESESSRVAEEELSVKSYEDSNIQHSDKMHDAIQQNVSCSLSGLTLARHAVIIDIHEYQHLPKLPSNNFSKELQISLEDNGWSVERFENLQKRDLLKAVENFKKHCEDTFAFMFYFGHSVQIHGENYILPVELQPLHAKTNGNLKKYAVDLNRILSVVATSKASCVVVDAGRPLPGLCQKEGLAGIKPKQNRCVLSAAPNDTKDRFLAELMCKSLECRDRILSVADLVEPFRHEVDVSAMSRRLLPMPFKVPSLAEGCEKKLLDLSSRDVEKYAFIFNETGTKEAVDVPTNWLLHRCEEELSLEEEFASFLKSVNDDSLKLCLMHYQGSSFVENRQLFLGSDDQVKNEESVSLSWILESMSENILGPRIVLIDTTGNSADLDSMDLDQLSLQEVLLMISSAPVDSAKSINFYREFSEIIGGNGDLGALTTELGTKHGLKIIRNSLFDIGI